MKIKMAEVNEGGNKFLLELKNALRKLNRSHDDEDDVDHAPINTTCVTSDALTSADVTCPLNDANGGGNAAVNGDANAANDSKAATTPCDRKAIPYVAPFDSKAAQKGLAHTKPLQPNGRVPGLHAAAHAHAHETRPGHAGLKVQVSDMDTPEGSNASSPKTMSTVYSSDKESTLQRQRSNPKTPSPAPRPIHEHETPPPLPHTSQRPPRYCNMKVAQADLYNELNSVLKKRNQMTRRSSILELERQKGCKTIVYYGRGGAVSGTLVRKASATSSSPSPLAAARARTVSITSRTDSLGSENMAAVESPLPPSGRTRNLPRVTCDSVKPPPPRAPHAPVPDVVQAHTGPAQPEPAAWVAPPTIGPDGGRRAAAATAHLSAHPEDAEESGVASLDSLPFAPPPVIYENLPRIVEPLSDSGPSKLLADLTRSAFCAEERISNSEPSEADSVVSQELLDLRKAFDAVDSRKAAAARSPVPQVSTDPASEKPEAVQQTPDVLRHDPKIRVELQWPQNASCLQDELRRWHERLNGRWTNQDEDDMLEDGTAFSPREPGQAPGDGGAFLPGAKGQTSGDGQGFHPGATRQRPGDRDGDVEPSHDRENPSGASQSSVEGVTTSGAVTSGSAAHAQLPRAGLTPSTRQRLRDIKLTAAAMLFPKSGETVGFGAAKTEGGATSDEGLETEEVFGKDLRGNDTEEEEKESSLDFTEEAHPGSLVSQLVDRVRGYAADTPTARARSEHGLREIGSDEASSELSGEGSAVAHSSGSEFRAQHAKSAHAQINQLPVMMSDVSLTSVTSYDVSLGDLTNDKYKRLGQSSNETLTFPHSTGSSDPRYTSGSSLNQNSRSWDLTDSQTSLVKSSGNVPGLKPTSQIHGTRLCPTAEETESIMQAYAGSSTMEGQKQFAQMEQKVFVKVMPHPVSRESSRGLADDKVRSLDRVLVRKCKHIVQCSLGPEPADAAGHASDGGGNYATYPPPSRPFTPQVESDDTITNLMITHSGDPLPPPVDCNTCSADSRHSCISANVTVPQPTSFHRHGNNVGDHLINPQRVADPRPVAAAASEAHVDSDGFQVSSSCTEYESGADGETGGVDGDAQSDPCHRRLLQKHAADSESGGEGDASSHHQQLHFQKKHVTVVDKESQRHQLFQTWSSNAAKKARDRGRVPHWRGVGGGSRSLHPGDESDSSVGHRGRHPGGYDHRSRRHHHHHSDHKLSSSGGGGGEGRSSSKSMVKSRLLRHVDSFSSCDAPCGEMGVYHQKRERTFSGGIGGAESVHSACTYVVESQEHSSDADTESLYQDYEQYEQSLIQYVRTEDLSQINEDIRSLYWQQFDSMSLPGLAGHQRGLLHRLVCCFLCEQHRRPAFPERPTSRASSSKTSTHDSGRVHIVCIMRLRLCTRKCECVDLTGATRMGTQHVTHAV